MKNNDLLKIGTCSWKYDSWIGLIYSKNAKANYLKEYSTHHKTVEIDQWFWSLFDRDQVKLPDPSVVETYAASVPDDFTFTVKVPNSITLTHHYNRAKNEPLRKNPHFLSNELFDRFLQMLAPLHSRLAAFIFQFEYLNKQKMAGLQVFLQQIDDFIKNCPPEFNYAVESRNPNYLKRKFFSFLQAKKIHPVLLQGYYMPPITDVYERLKENINKLCIIRLHGPNRKEIEAQSGKNWNRILAPKDAEIKEICRMITELMSSGTEVYVNVNNHYEGSAPLTIEKVVNCIEQQQDRHR
jgi:uncharacterized protein YecE (DUF72 family)